MFIHGRLQHASFDLKILQRLIRSEVFLLNFKLHLHLGIDFLIVSLSPLNNLVSMISKAIKYYWLQENCDLDHYRNHFFGQQLVLNFF